MAIKDIIRARKKQNRGRAWHQDRMMKSQEPWEKKYKKKSRGLAYASEQTKQRVSSKGGRASHRRRR